MIKYNYIRLSKLKIRYLKNNQKNKPYIVFLHGFKSDLDGKSSKAFFNFSIKNNLGFFSFRIFRSWKKSSGKFINGNISIWTKETSVLIRKNCKK